MNLDRDPNDPISRGEAIDIVRDAFLQEGRNAGLGPVLDLAVKALASLPAVPPKAEVGKPMCVRCFAYLTCPVCAWPAPPIETEVAPAIPLDDEIEVRLVPVEVFGAGCDESDHEGSYGLCDAVEAWSDCNRAYGHIFRFDDDFQIDFRKPGETLAVRVNAAEYEAFAATRWGQDDDERDRLRSQHPEFDSGALPVLETKKEES